MHLNLQNGKIKIFGFFVFFLTILTVGLFFLKSVSAQGNSEKARANHQPVCPGPSDPDSVRCHARVIVDDKGLPNVVATPSGYGPKQLRGAYQLGSGTTSTKQIIAVVDAYDHPNILSDLNTYSDTFGIPRLANCPVSQGTVTVPCFQKVDQRGGTKYPKVNAGWALEIAMDVEAAHAVCENCSILLVEADSNSYTNLMAAVDRAVLMGAKVVSNSYGSSEFSGETLYDSHFNKPGVAFTFSSGDSGYGTSYPAASKYVIAVGGTTLNVNKNSDGSYSYGSETAWAGSGSGCSAYQAKPSWQLVVADSVCNDKRMIADVSAVADPQTGASVYSSVRYQGQKGWFQVGGTSLSAPVVAGVYALKGDMSTVTNPASLPYSRQTNLNDVTQGSNGNCGTYMCNAQNSYDGPTGLGTPHGIDAF